MESNLQSRSHEALLCPDPDRKCDLVGALARDWDQGRLDHQLREQPMAIPIPGRPNRPELVAPAQLPRRRLGQLAGRIALIHAVAHIEFNAINLALDAVYRFGPMPRDYYGDWISVAVDESRHFQMMHGRLEDLGADYGDLDAHNGLWEMALVTADRCLERMALVPRVLEARGLDVTPGMIDRVRSVGDEETVAALQVILAEEVRHVEIGTRWFRWCCDQEGEDPDQVFSQLIRERVAGAIRSPFNRPARQAAGFSEEEMKTLDELGGARI